jgi:hypothetical protein
MTWKRSCSDRRKTPFVQAISRAFSVELVLISAAIAAGLSGQVVACPWHRAFLANPEISKDYRDGVCPSYQIKQPVITGPAYVCPGEQVTFCVIAEDKDYVTYVPNPDYQGDVPDPGCEADTLTGTWSCSDGSFPNGNKGMSVSWIAPQQYGAQCSISCTVDEEANDGHPVVNLPDTGSRDDSPKTATGLTVTVGIHTLAVTQPAEDAHVCYSDDEWKYAEVRCQATVDPACYESEIVWSHDTVPGTTMAWVNNINTGSSTTLTLTGLPPLNSSFGRHSVTATVRGQSMTRQYKLFYPWSHTATNHPGEGAGVTPNWYYYYSQTSASQGVPYDPAFYFPPPGGYAKWDAMCGSYVAYLCWNANIPMLSRTSWGSPYYIDVFGWLSRHELRHVAQMTGFWGNNDRVPGFDADGDYIPDVVEATVGRGGYNMFCAATYSDTVAYGVNPIPDMEDLCMREDNFPWAVVHLWRTTQRTRKTGPI